MSAQELKQGQVAEARGKGRRPAAERGEDVTPLDVDFGNKLRLDPALVAELRKQGLAYRLCNAKQLESFGNMDKNGWRPYRRESSGNMDPGTFKSGVSPDGLVRLGTLVLAVRSAEVDRAHKRLIKQKAEMYSNVQRISATQMREAAKEHGLSPDVIDEGYDGGDDD